MSNARALAKKEEQGHERTAIKALWIILTGLLLLTWVIRIRVSAQSIYGVSPRRTKVMTSSGRVAHRTTVVRTTDPALAAGYIAVLPGGYRIVTVRGVRCYHVGGIYYRAQFYQGRTVYVRYHV